MVRNKSNSKPEANKDKHLEDYILVNCLRNLVVNNHCDVRAR